MMSWRGPFHPNRGGAELYTEEILTGLSKRGHAVTWYSGSFSGPKPANFGSVELVYGLSGLKTYVGGNRWLRRNFKCYDVIVDQLNTFGFMAPRVSNKVVVLFHQLASDVWDLEVPFPINKIGKSIERWVLKRYSDTPFITMSATTVKEMHQLGWNGAGIVAGTGISRISDYSKTEFPSICFLGRFQAKAKRLDHAVQIFDLARDVIPELRFRIIGRGSPPRRFLGKAGLEFYTDVGDRTRDELLGSSWCCVATSVREGWGRMVSEAGAMGTPTLAYRVPGLRDSVVNGVSGVLVDESPLMAANRLIDLLRQPEMLAKMGQEAQTIASEMVWDASIDKFEQVLVSIARVHGSDDKRFGNDLR